MSQSPATLPAPKAATVPQRKQPPLWHVVLLDDQEHTYDYVIELAQTLFAHPLQRAVEIAKTVDKEGRAVLVTTHREYAELKVEQVHTFGADHRIASCKGAMSAVLEPASTGDDEDQAL